MKHHRADGKRDCIPWTAEYHCVGPCLGETPGVAALSVQRKAMRGVLYDRNPPSTLLQARDELLKKSRLARIMLSNNAHYWNHSAISLNEVCAARQFSPRLDAMA